jgi:integrase/recombinase XerD
MASLRQRSNGFMIQFSKRDGDKIIQKSFVLGTTDRKKAERLKIEFEDKFDMGEIDPFNGWTPTMEIQKRKEAVQKSYMNLEQATKIFIEERSQANAVTKRAYRAVLNMLSDQIGKSMPLSRITSKDIRTFCFRSNIAVATQRSYFTHCKVFFNWLHENDYLDTNLTKGIKPPKPEERIVDKVITEQELNHLFNVFDAHIARNLEVGYIKHENQQMKWFKPMISTFFFAGLRSKELIHLRWKDILEDFKYILVTNSQEVTTKSGKSRKVPIRTPLAIILKEWKEATNPLPSDYIFSNVNDIAGKQKMNPFRISQTFKRFVRMAQLPENCNIHGLRHSFGTDLLRKGIPINRVSEMMGHSTIEVTKIYQHLTPEDLYESIRDID